MIGGDFFGIGDGGEIDLLVPLDKFSGMIGKQTAVTAVNINSKGLGLVNEKIRPWDCANFHFGAFEPQARYPVVVNFN